MTAAGTPRPPSERSPLPDLHVHESGSSASPAIVFIHGGGPSGLMWMRHLDALGSRFHCLAPDLPGFGRSGHLPAISLRATASLIAELIGARTASGKAHLVGLSYGGSVAFAVLDRHADVVDRAVIDGAGPFTSRTDPIVVGAAMLVSPLMGSRLTAAVLRVVGLGGLGTSLRFASPGAIRRAWREGYLAPVSAAQLRARCPTLFVAGEHEAPVRASNAAFAAEMPSAEARYVARSGHAWFGWHPDLHIQMVEAWLTGAPLPDGLVPEPSDPAAVIRLRRLIDGQPDRPAVPGEVPR